MLNRCLIHQICDQCVTENEMHKIWAVCIYHSFWNSCLFFWGPFLNSGMNWWRWLLVLSLPLLPLWQPSLVLPLPWWLSRTLKIFFSRYFNGSFVICHMGVILRCTFLKTCIPWWMNSEQCQLTTAGAKHCILLCVTCNVGQENWDRKECWKLNCFIGSMYCGSEELPEGLVLSDGSGR